MTFLNGLLAAGSLAFVVPLAIHLLFRSRFRVVDWGAMHLLDGVLRVNRRRIVWSHWLLLVLRCLIPILLAFCLARPVLTGFRTLPGSAPQTLVLVVDDSRSMAARDSQGTPRIERLKAGVNERLATLTQEDEVFLIRTSRIDELPARLGVSRAAERVRRLTASGGPADLHAAVNAALQAAGQGSFPQRRIWVASDFQSVDLDETLLASLEPLGRLWRSFADPPAVSFWNLAGDTDRLSNLSVDEVEVESPAVVLGRPVPIRARIRNASESPAGNLPVTWMVDGRTIESGQVSLPPRGSATVRTTHTFTAPGKHELGVAIDVADALPEDNRRRIAVDVIEEIEVLMVDGRPGRRLLQGESDFLTIALSPFAFSPPPMAGGTISGGDAAGASPMPGGVIRSRGLPWEDRAGRAWAGRFADELDSPPPDVLVLLNVASLDESAEAAVVEFVLGGGALIVFDGDRLDPEFYNRPWRAGDDQVEMPAESGSLVGRTAGPGLRPGGSFAEDSRDDDPSAEMASGGDLADGVSSRFVQRLGEPDAQFSPWAFLRAGDQTAADRVRVVTVREMTPRPGAQVWLPLADGRPLVIAHEQGAGTVVRIAIAAHPGWSNLPLRPAFVPLMQQLMLAVAGRGPAGEVGVGEPIRVPLSEFDRIGGPIGGAARYTVEPPGEAESAIEPRRDGEPSLVFPDTDRPGVYRFRRFGKDDSGTERTSATLRVAEVDAAESQLRDAAPERVRAFAEAVGGRVFGNLDTLLAEEQTDRFGREVWRWLWLGLLGVMVGELVVAQGTRRILRRGSGTGGGP